MPNLITSQIPPNLCNWNQNRAKTLSSPEAHWETQPLVLHEPFSYTIQPNVLCIANKGRKWGNTMQTCAAWNKNTMIEMSLKNVPCARGFKNLDTLIPKISISELEKPLN